MTYEQVKEVLKNYFSIVKTVEKFSITGGEPLICPDLLKIVEEILGYEEQITKEIILITNGTIRLTEKMIELFQKSKKMKVIVNNYGNLSKYAKENLKKLEEAKIINILYDEENRYGWVDCRDHNLKHKTKEDVEKQAAGCAFFYGKKYVIKNGILYTCTRAAYRIQEGLIPSTPEDYINLNEAGSRIEEEREKMVRWGGEKYTPSCAYCDGLTEESKKYIAAEQLERGKTN